MRVALMLIALMAPEAATPEVVIDDLGWRSVYRCGPNCLYVVLTMQGEQVDYESLVDELNLTDRGASVADLVRVANTHGMQYTPLRAGAKYLSKLPLPAIVHFNNPGDDKGHFVVLLSVGKDDTLTIIECTRGRMERLSRGDFLTRWSGVVVVRSERLKNSHLDNWLLVSSGFLLLLAIVGLVSWRRAKHAPMIA